MFAFVATQKRTFAPIEVEELPDARKVPGRIRIPSNRRLQVVHQ